MLITSIATTFTLYMLINIELLSEISNKILLDHPA